MRMLPRFQLTSIFSKNLAWLEQQQNSILSAAVIITAANVVSSLSGLIRERMLLGQFFNTAVASKEAYEAFLIAFQVPDMLFQLIAVGAISATFIPIFTKLKNDDRETAYKMSAVILNYLMVTFFALGLVIFITVPYITALRTGDKFTLEQMSIVNNLTRMMLIAQFFLAISSIFSATLQSYQRFIIPSLAPIIYNIGIVAGAYFLGESFGIYAAGVGVIIGAFLHMIIQLPSVLRTGLRYTFSFDINTPGVKQLLSLAPPRILTIGVNEVQNLSLGYFATSLGNLSFVIIKLALRLMTIPIRLFGVPISQASLPFLSEESHQKDLQHFRRLVVQSVHQIAFLAFPASVLLLILRIPIVRLAYGTANFPWERTIETGWAVAIISLSVAAQAIVQLIMRAFYALKDTKTPFYITLFSVAFYLAGTAIFAFYTDWQVYGLALMTTLSAIVELFLAIFFLHKRVGGFSNGDFWLPQLKMLLASFFMAVFLYLPYRIFDELIFDTSRSIELIGLTITTGTIGILVYFYFASLLDIKELQLFQKLLLSFNSSRKGIAPSSEMVVETSGENSQV